MADYVEHLISLAGGDGDVATAQLDGPTLVAGILARKALATADAAYTAALGAAVGGYGDWAAVRQAHEAVKQTRATLKATEETA